MKLVAPTLAFWVYPKPFKSIDFTHRFRYGCNRFSQYGRSEQYDDKSHIISVNMFEILKDNTYIDSNKVLFDFNINLELSKWYCSRLRNATTFKIHMALVTVPCKQGDTLDDLSGKATIAGHRVLEHLQKEYDISYDMLHDADKQEERLLEVGFKKIPITERSCFYILEMTGSKEE